MAIAALVRRPCLAAAGIMTMCLAARPALAQNGHWEPAVNFWTTPFSNEISHAALTATSPNAGKVLLLRTGFGQGRAYLWDPAAPGVVADAGQLVTIPMFSSSFSYIQNFYDQLFCSGHTWDQNGTIDVHGFYFYPRTHVLHSGHLFVSVAEGSAVDMPTTPSAREYSVSAIMDISQWPPPAPPAATGPWAWGLQHYDNRLMNSAGQTVNLDNAMAVLAPHHIGANGQVLSQDTVIVLGGWDNQPSPHSHDAFNNVWRIQSPATTKTSFADPAGGGSRWEPWSSHVSGGTTVPGMKYKRVYGNVVLLPDLSMIVFGGSLNEFHPFGGNGAGDPELTPFPVYHPEQLDLTVDPPVWVERNPATSPRLYHSVGVLLKDGRVANFGGYKGTNPQLGLNHTECEVFVPPYLEVGGVRPSISGVLSDLTYGVPTTVGVTQGDFPQPAANIAFATLMRCGSVTHHFDYDQRAIRLDIQSRTDTTVTLAPLPLKGGTTRGDFLAPPGYYMLFLVSTPQGTPPTRIPSVARFVRLQ